MTPYQEGMLPLRSYLIDARMLLFMAEQVFLLMGEGGFWLMHNANTQCAMELGGESRLKGRKCFLFKFLSCHQIRILLYK